MSGTEKIGEFTLDQLSDYLDAGMHPARPDIDNSAEALHVLSQLKRLKKMAASIAEEEMLPNKFKTWWDGLLNGIATDIYIGRKIALPASPDGTQSYTTEGAIKALIRTIGDEIGEGIVTKITFDGELETPGAPISATLKISVVHGCPIPNSAELIRSHIRQEVIKRTGLNISTLDAVVSDILFEDAQAE